MPYLLHNTHTPHQRLLPKSRLAPADEPPAEEAHEAAHDDDRGDGDARDGPAAETTLVGAGGRAARPICTQSVPRDTLCAYLGIVCARLAFVYRTLFASAAISLSVSISADLTSIISAACGAVRDGARYTLRSISAELLVTVASEALERG